MISGEKLTKEEAKGLMKELCEPEDDEGFMPFMRKFMTIITLIKILIKMMTKLLLIKKHQQMETFFFLNKV